MTKSPIEKLLKKKGGIQLDIGCGANRQDGWVGMDVQDLPTVDIVWDFNIHPWPLPDECCTRILCSHVIEHIPPVMIHPEAGTTFPFIQFMDDVWRILKYDCEFLASVPHGLSSGMLQDPTHVNFLNQNTWRYFDPLEDYTNGLLYSFYRPKPWKIVKMPWQPNGNLEVVMVKRREDWSYDPNKKEDSDG